MKAFGFIEFVMFKGKHMYICVYMCACKYIYILQTVVYLSDTRECTFEKDASNFFRAWENIGNRFIFFYIYVKALNILWKKKKH